MRATFFITSVLLFASAIPCFAASITRQDAVSRAQSAGYSLISKTEAAPGSWDVWASKEGIAYEVKINARDGSLMTAIPVEDND